MLIQLIILIVLLGFASLVTSFFVKRLGNKVVLLSLAMIFFAAAGLAATDTDILVCDTYVTSQNSSGTGTNSTIVFANTQSCTIHSFFFEEMVWMFGFLSLLFGVMVFIKVLDAFYGKTEEE